MGMPILVTKIVKGRVHLVCAKHSNRGHLQQNMTYDNLIIFVYDT